MRKRVAFTAVLLVLALSAVMLACEPKQENDPDVVRIAVSALSDRGTRTVTVLAPNGGQTETSAQSVGALLRELRDANKLQLKASESDYGLFITGIGSLDPSGSEFIGFYSTCSDIQYVGNLTPFELGGKRYYMTNCGVDNMPLMADTEYLFKVDAYIA